MVKKVPYRLDFEILESRQECSAPNLHELTMAYDSMLENVCCCCCCCCFENSKFMVIQANRGGRPKNGHPRSRCNVMLRSLPKYCARLAWITVIVILWLQTIRPHLLSIALPTLRNKQHKPPQLPRPKRLKKRRLKARNCPIKMIRSPICQKNRLLSYGLIK